jgi:hypothetical protein
LGLDHCAHAGAPCFHLADVGFHLYLLGHVPDTESDGDLRAAGDLQFNAGLHVLAKSLLGCFQPVRTERQIGQNVRPIFIGHHCSSGAGVGLHCRDSRASDRATALIMYRAVNLRRSLCPRDCRDQRREKKTRKEFPH